MSNSPPKQRKGSRGPTPTELQLRIDADFIAYRACEVNEIEVDWGEDLITIASSFKEVVAVMTREIRNLKSKFSTDNVVLYFTDSSNFRKQLDPSYKGKRTKRKPVGYKRLLEWCRENYPSITLANLEADDVLGIHCHDNTSGPFILVSPDKDLKQIACRHYNFADEFEITEEEANRFFFQQVITGDPVDGYKGIPGIGEKKAQAILNKPGDTWQHIVEAYEKAGLTAEDALRQARLARILRPGEYDFDTLQPILWNPTTST